MTDLGFSHAVDHLVNNAGIVHSFFFETAKNTAGMLQVMVCP
jgi:short-subunit dehydrogenase